MNGNEENYMDILNLPILAEEIIALPSEWDCYPILWEEIEVNTASSSATHVKKTADDSKEIKDTSVQEASDVKAQPEEVADSSDEEEKENWHGFKTSAILTKRQFKRKLNGLIAVKFGTVEMGYHFIDVKNNQIIVSKYGCESIIVEGNYVAVIDKTDIVEIKGVYDKNAVYKSRLEDSYSQIQVYLIDGRVLVIQDLCFNEKEFNEFVDSFRKAIKQ